MTLDTIGKPFQGSVKYWEESSYGSLSGVSLAVSCKVQNVRIETGDIFKTLRDIGSPLVCAFIKQTREPKFHLEYIPQEDDTLMETAINSASSCCTLQSLTFNVGINICESDPDNQSWYLIAGCKPSSCRISASKNTEVLVSLDYECQSIVTSCAETGSSPTPLTGEYLAFNVAGSITKTGGFNPTGTKVAYITNSIELNFTHKLTGYTDHDSLVKAYLIEGEYDVEGSVDITLDGGGAMHIGEVLNMTEFELEWTMGLNAPSPVITLPVCAWKNGAVETNVGGEAIFFNNPFTAKITDCSTPILTHISP